MTEKDTHKEILLIHKAGKRASASKQKALQFLINAGILTVSGNLKDIYKKPMLEKRARL